MAPNQTLDSLIYTGIILLVLSQIAEKITTFIRTYLKAGLSQELALKKGFSARVRLFLTKKIRGLLSTLVLVERESDMNRGAIQEAPDVQQPRIEFAITKLSLLVSVTLALSFHADLFKIVSSKDPHSILHWGDGLANLKISFWELFNNPTKTAWSAFGNILWAGLETFAGCFATGFLLTFGSKFFHDLLEILYEIKRARRNLADQYVFASRDKATLDQRLESPLGDAVAIVLEHYKEILLNQFNSIVSIERVFDNQGESILEIRTKDASEQNRLEQYRFDYPDRDGDKVLSRTRVKIIPNSPIIKIQQKQLIIGKKVGRINMPDDYYGTIGFFALQKSDNRKVFVTCAHVIDPDATKIPNDNSLRMWGEDKAGQKSEVGTLTNFEMNKWMDAAIILIDDDIDPRNYDADKDKIFTKVRTLSWEESGDVWTNGATSPMLHGQVRSHQNAIQIDYGSGGVRTLYNLIRISDTNSNAVSYPGDSGSLVFDKDMNAVGMIVAGNPEMSYAIPLQRILDRLDLKVLVAISHLS